MIEDTTQRQNSSKRLTGREFPLHIHSGTLNIINRTQENWCARNVRCYEIIESIMEIAPQFEHKPVKTFFLKIGKLSNIVVDSLTFCYDTVKADYPLLAQSRLSVEIVPIRGECQQCGYRFDIQDMFFVCPRCSSGNVVLEQGQELEISELEVEE